MVPLKDVLREKLLSSIKVIFDKENPERSGCWEWQKTTTSNGYGTFQYNNVIYGAHIASAYCYGLIKELYEIFRGGKNILHKCNNKKCINPSHLYVGTPKDNIWDQIKAGTFRSYGRKIRVWQH